MRQRMRATAVGDGRGARGRRGAAHLVVLSVLVGVLATLTATVVTPTPAAAVDDEPCADPATDPFDGGSGTPDDPYLIATADQLAAIAQPYQFCVFRQTADISLAAYREWRPIGSWNFFGGVYDGDGHLISNMRVESNQNFRGLFSRIESYDAPRPAAVRNLRLSGSVSGTTDVGGLAGSISGTAAQPVTISNVHVDVTVTGRFEKVGGLVGSVSTAIIEKSSSTGSVTSLGGSNHGGLVGQASTLTLSDSFARGNVRGNANVGGLIGATYSTNTIDRSYSTGAVTGASNVAGLIWFVFGTTTATASYWDTTVNGALTSSHGTGKTTSELTNSATYTSPWSISTAWGTDTGSTWIICAGLNDGYPVLRARYSADPCTAAAVTVTGASFTTTADRTVGPVSFVAPEPLSTPSDWDTAPTCAVYDATNAEVDIATTGALAVGTYTTRCTGGTSGLATSVSHQSGTITVNTAPAGGRLLASEQYSSTSSNVTSSDADGTDTRVLASTTVADASPEWSPNGDAIAFIDNASGVGQVFTMTADGSDITQVTTITDALKAPTSLAWLDDDTLLVSTLLSTLYLLDGVAGATPTYTAIEGAPAFVAAPSLNGDGTAITYMGTAIENVVPTYCMMQPCQAQPTTRYFVFSAPITVDAGTGAVTVGTPVKLTTIGTQSPGFSPVWDTGGTSVVYVTSTNDIVQIDVATKAATTILAASGSSKPRGLAIDPDSGRLFYGVCVDGSCVSPQDLYSMALPTAQTPSPTPTLVRSHAGSPSLTADTTPAPATGTTTSTAVASSSIVSGTKISATTTVTAASGSVDPTGTVTHYYCYDASTAPAVCDVAAGTKIADVTLTNDGTADGTTTAGLTDWTPASGAGFYRFFATYTPSGNFEASSESGTDLTVGVDNAASCGTAPEGTFEGGKGTLLNPYQVATAAQLAAITGDRTTCRFLQTADISLASYRRWTPIRWDNTGFTGVYDGGGYAITGMSIEGGGTSTGTGLFGKLGSGAIVRNLLVQGSVAGTGFLGGLTGIAVGATISNVHVDVDVAAPSNTATRFSIGGLAGALRSGSTLEKSSSFGDVSGGSDAGGLVGSVEASYVNNSFARGAVIGWANVGGVVGQMQGTNPTLTNTYATGVVTVASGSTSTAIGGLLGKRTTGTVTASYWSSTANPSISGGEGTAASDTELATVGTYSAWSIAGTWSTASTWVACAGLNVGFPTLTGRYDTDPCTSSGTVTVTVTASSMTIPSDLTAPAVSFSSSPGLLPGDFDTAPTCGIYDDANTLQTGKLPAGTYTSRCRGAVWSLATDIRYADGVVTVTATDAGGRLVVALPVGSIADIATATTDGSATRRLATGKTITMRPEWSPNGRKIAYIDEVNGLRQVFVMDADGSNGVQMTSDVTSAMRPESLAWLDNSQVIVDTATDKAYLLTAKDTYAITAVTSFPGMDLALSPAGDKLAFIDLGRGLQYGSLTNGVASTLTRNSSTSWRYPAYGKDGATLVALDANLGRIKVLRAGSGSFVDLYTPPSGKGIRELTVDPVSGDVYFDLCTVSSCSTEGTYDVYRFSIPQTGTVSSATLVMTGATSPSLGPLTTTTESAVSSSIADYGGEVDVTITVATGTTVDPSGKVTLRYCFNATTAPASCDASTGKLIGTDYTLDAGTADDGEAAATVADWVPTDGPGYYRVFAAYAGAAGTMSSDESGTDITLTVGPGTLVVTPDDIEVSYGADIPDYTFEITGWVGSDDIDDLDTPPTCTSSYTDTTSVSSSALEIICFGGVDDNYTFDTSATATLTIDPAEVTVTPKNQTVTYGDPVPDYTFEITGWVNGDDIDDLDEPPSCTSPYPTSEGVSATPLEITCTAGSDADYTFDVSATADLTVDPATLTVTPDPQSVSVGDPAPDYTFDVKGFVGTETVDSAAGYQDPSCTSTYTATTSASASPLQITCTGGSADNYTFDTSATANLTIDPAELTVTPKNQTVTYGDPVPDYTFEITGWVGSDGIADLVRAPTCTSAYSITTSVSSSALEITCFGGIDDNYTFDTSATATLTIDPAEVTVTPKNQTVTYGDPVPDYTFEITGWVNGDDIDDLDEPPFCTSPYPTSEGVSATPLEITCTAGSDADYTFDVSATADLTVDPATLTVTPDPQSVSVGDPAPDYTFDVKGFVGTETVDNAAGYQDPSCTSTYTATTSASASPLQITCTGSSADNYTFDTSATANLTIDPAELTVTPKNQTVTYGDPVPDYTFEITGWVNGDDIDDLDEPPFCTSPYPTSTGASATPLEITCTAGSDADYTFDVSATADLTVDPATLTVTPDPQSVSVGDPAPDYTFDVKGFVGTETVDNAAGYQDPSCTSSYTATTSASASPLQITCTGGSADNYTFDTSATANLTIGTVELTVTPKNITVTYGDPVPDYTFEITGWVGSDDIDDLDEPPSCTSPYPTSEGVSATPLEITCTAGSDADYTFDVSATAGLTVDPATLTVTPDPQSVSVGDPAPDYTFDVKGFVGTETVDSAAGYQDPSCTSTYSATTSASVSPLVIGCSGGSADNYTFDTSATAELTIGKVMLTVTPKDVSVDYGDPVPEYEFEITGWVNGDGIDDLAIAPSCTSSYSITTPVSASALEIGCFGGTDDDYTFDTSATAELTVEKAVLTVLPEDQSVSVGDAAPDYSFVVEGFVGSETALTAAGYQVPSCSSEYTSSTSASVSPLVIGCSGGSADNYTFDTSATAELTIGKVMLTVTPDSLSVPYGSIEPTYTFTATGWVNGDTVSVLDTAPECDSAYTPTTGTAASPLEITCTGGSDDNYTFNTSAVGTLTITAADVPITPSFPASVSPGELVQSLSVDLGGAAPASAVAAMAIDECAVGRTVTFSVVPAPVPAGPFSVTSGDDGIAATPLLQLAPGVSYTVTVTVSATDDCAAQTLTSTLATEGEPGRRSTGSGTHAVTVAGKTTTAKVSHSVSSTTKTSRNGDRTTTYSGDLSWEVAKAWRFSGTVSSRRVVNRAGVVSGYASFVTDTCPSAELASGTPSEPPVCGVVVGAGTLQQWDPTANRGRGKWVSTPYGTLRFSATLHDGGTSRRCTGRRCTTVTNPDEYALELFSPTVTLPALPLPTALVPLKGSIVNVR